MTVVRRTMVAIGIAALAMLGLAGPASAHNVLISSDPAQGAALETGPATITLNFDQYVQAGDVNQIAVTGPDGTQWTDGQVQVRDSTVTTPVRPLGPAGQYTVGYAILSADGHSVRGEIRFNLTKPGNGTPAAAKPSAGASSDSGGSGGVPVWVWIGGAVVLLGIGLTVALRMGRGAQPGQRSGEGNQR